MSDASSMSAVRTAVKAAAGLGVPGVFAPGLDEAGMAAIWTTMITTIARRRGVGISAVAAGKIVASASASVAAYRMGSRLLTLAMAPLLLVLPIVGVPAAVALNSILNAWFTYRLGVACDRRFADPGFSARECLLVVKGLAGLPTVSELVELSDMLRG
jgi:hypothetical protein